MKHLVIGGAGFIGSNLANRLLTNGQEVIIVDNLSRHGSGANLAWLKQNKRAKLSFIHADIVKDIDALAFAVKEVDRIYQSFRLEAENKCQRRYKNSIQMGKG